MRPTPGTASARPHKALILSARRKRSGLVNTLGNTVVSHRTNILFSHEIESQDYPFMSSRFLIESLESV